MKLLLRGFFPAMVVFVSIAMPVTGCAARKDVAPSGEGDSTNSSQGSGSSDASANPMLIAAWRVHLNPQGVTAPYFPEERSKPVLLPKGGNLFLGTSDGRVHCLSATDGRSIWSVGVDGPILAPVALAPHQPLVLAATKAGEVSALTQSRGEKVWQFKSDSGYISAPIADGERAYVLNVAGNLSALSLENGEVIWNYRRPLPEGFTLHSLSDLVLSREQLIAGFADGTVSLLNATDGQEVWSRQLITRAPLLERRGHMRDISSGPMLSSDGNLILVASFNGGLFALSRETGEIHWSLPDVQAVTGMHLDSRGGLLLSTAKGEFVRVEQETGLVTNRRRISDSALLGISLLTAQHALIPNSEKGLLLVGLPDGKILQEIQPGPGVTVPPLVGNGGVWMLSNGGYLYAFRRELVTTKGESVYRRWCASLP